VKKSLLQLCTHLKLLQLFFIAAVALLAVPVTANERQVSLNLEELPGAKFYEVDVSTESGEAVKRLKFAENEFTIPLKAGRYRLRTRSLDSRMVTGAWSEWEELIVPPANVQMKRAPQKPVLAAGGSLKADVPLIWQSVPGTESYKLLVLDTEGKTVFETTISDNKINLKMTAGDYKVVISGITAGIESLEKTEVPVSVIGAQMPPVEIQDILRGESGFSVAWSAAAEGAEYKVSLQRRDIDENIDEQMWEDVATFDNQTVTNLVLPNDLRPGAYRVNIAAAAKGWRPSAESVKEFVVKPTIRSLSSIEADAKVSFDFKAISK
jgi:hypothetical protein